MWKTMLVSLILVFVWGHDEKSVRALRSLICLIGPQPTSPGAFIPTLVPEPRSWFCSALSIHPLPTASEEHWSPAQPQPFLCLAMGPADLDSDPWADLPAWPRTFLVTVDLPGRSLSYSICFHQTWSQSFDWLPSLSQYLPHHHIQTDIWTLGPSWLLSWDLLCSPLLDTAEGSYHASWVFSLSSLVLWEQPSLVSPWQQAGQVMIFKK